MSVQTDVKMCTNCKRDISLANFATHEAYCYRHNTLCPKCNETVGKKELEKHDEEFHALVDCELCKQKVEQMNVEDHKLECLYRSVECEYCDLPQPFVELKEHQKVCGSRTEMCSKCQRHIMLSDMFKHEASSCQHPPVVMTEKPAAISRPYISTSSSSAYGHGRAEKRGSSSRNPYTSVSTHGSNSQTIFNRPTLFCPVSELDDQHDISPIQQSYESLSLSQMNTQSANSFDRNNLLPCEFCNMSFEPNELEVHQRSCDPLLCEPIPTSQQSQENFLPCEFCSELFHPEMLIFHQDTCSYLPMHGTVSEHSDEELHQLPSFTRPLVPDRTITRDMAPSSSMNENDLIPCEICNEVFPLEVYPSHQLQCGNPVYETATLVPPVENNARDNSIAPPLHSHIRPRDHNRRTQPTSMGDGTHPTAMWSNESLHSNPPATAARPSNATRRTHRGAARIRGVPSRRQGQ